MSPALLLVDDQRDILRLLHSALDTLREPDMEIFEAASGEAALKHLGEHAINLLVTDYNLPGITGAELMRQARVTQPDLPAIVITGNTDRKVRDEILKTGALAVFSKPVPLGDFLGAVERGLGLVEAPAAAPMEIKAEVGPVSLPDALEQVRSETGADAVMLMSRRGKVDAMAGRLRDSSMEVSLTSALAAYFMAALKVAESNRQQSPDHVSTFSGGDQDLIFMPVDPSHALVLAGASLAAPDGLAKIIKTMNTVRAELARGLREAIAAVESASKAENSKERREPAVMGNIETLLESADSSGLSEDDMDAYWEAAAEQHGNKPTSKDVIPYEEARKLGLTPDSEDK
ncbi:MAG TPA: response regulator [Anaerolineales bacterium]|nr:response regulator [Anaerolineales bacterium]